MAVQSNGHATSNGTHGPSVRFAPPKTTSSSRMNTYLDLDEYDQPDSSPYESRRIIVLLGPHERQYSIPEYYLRQSPIFTDILRTYPHFITKTVPCIPLPEVDDDIVHTVVHYLHTGSYQTLRPAGGSDWTKTEYRRSVLVYGVAAKYELVGLQTLARKYLQKLDTHLSIFDVLGVARKVYGGKVIPDYDPWFFDDYVRGKMADAFVEDRDLFERPRFQYLLGAETGFDRFLVQALVSIYEARIQELEKRAMKSGMQRSGYEGMMTGGAGGGGGGGGLEDIAEEYPDERAVSVDEMIDGEEEEEEKEERYEGQTILERLEAQIRERPPSSAHDVSEGYPVSVAEEPIEEYSEAPTAPTAAHEAEYADELPAERYAPAEEAIVEEEAIPNDEGHQAEPHEITADDSWNDGWGNWAARTREWGYTSAIHEEPGAADPGAPDPVADPDLAHERVPEPVAEEPLPDYAEVQPVVSEDHAQQENRSVKNGKKKNGKERKKKSTMSRTRALFSSTEEQPREQAVF
ncbi:uncharacterized protein BP01DRAFT_387231 [Aspergillus saccharolyticus JOP 1030-1]|uniref:BTB domain-containing protein n=1 Tax=Aspergillus saccharolyticus JOP 1030-1 TaxID=1450539 RepID=A0A318Z755_9EURO|nr:hypothetical protein BP01DRAFT_387231 [Aspergillus saccharolyticus JOP 1030-1]PYH40563.1 hypothetical protein BP01DRAFT_387231 [Aspergillus saccharolyticus JOP 1030-1]